jgi:hypothetical protein
MSRPVEFAGLAVGLAIVLALAPVGCRVGALGPSPNDPLRDENRSLRESNAELSARVAELEAKLAAVEAERVEGGVDPEVVAQTPAATRLELKSSSVVEPVRGQPGRGVARVWLEPVDGRGRFVQVTGWLEVAITALPATGPAVAIGSIRLGPAEVRDAYRSGFMGTHYTVEVPVDLAAAGTSPNFAVSATFTEGRSRTAMTVAGTATRLDPVEGSRP